MSAKYHHAIQFALVTLIAFVMRNWGQWLCTNELCSSYNAVYWIMGAFSAYHLIMVCVISILSVIDFEVYIYNHWFLWKYLGLIGLEAYAFAIGELDLFSSAGLVFLILGIAYLLLQIYLLIKFSSSLAQDAWDWIHDTETQQITSNRMLTVLGVVSLTYGGCVAGLICLVVILSSSEENRQTNAYIAWAEAFLIAIASWISVSQTVRKANSSMGLIQVSWISAYAVFVLLSSVSSQPVSGIECVVLSDDVLWEVLFFVGILVSYLLLIYGAAAAESIDSREKVPSLPISSDESSISGNNKMVSKTQTRAYIMVHVAYFLAGFYAADLLTNWSQQVDFMEDNVQVFCINYGIIAFWIKVASAYSIHVIFILHALIPAFLG